MNKVKCNQIINLLTVSYPEIPLSTSMYFNI